MQTALAALPSVLAPYPDAALASLTLLAFLSLSPLHSLAYPSPFPSPPAPLQDMLTEAGQRAPMGRGVTGEDVGALATFLASKQAEAITGQTLYVDGGLSIY